MKHLFLALTLALTTTVASAAGCFNFVNGKGPSKIGNFYLGSTATSVCLNKVNKIHGVTELHVELSDAQGLLAVFVGEDYGTARCLGFCKATDLEYGTVQGRSVDLRGAKVEVQAKKSNLNLLIGTMTIQAGRGFAEKFTVMEAR